MGILAFGLSTQRKLIISCSVIYALFSIAHIAVLSLPYEKMVPSVPSWTPFYHSTLCARWFS